MPRARRCGLLALARALAGKALVLDAGAERDAARRCLLALEGIGPWTVEYIAMRALRDPDAFPASDLGVRHALEQLGRDGRPAAAEELAERWRPYRAYAVQHLWASLAPAPRAKRVRAHRSRPRSTVRAAL
jgi:AraC family transcriptional regulator, regulatory protein of adaptative response / DNA-3-methyladenine glycosylase II